MSKQPATNKPAEPPAITPRQAATYRVDPREFVRSLPVPTPAGGPRSFGEIMAPHQVAWLENLAPAFLAISRGEVPRIGRFWIEATKGSGKDHILAALMLWLVAFAARPLLAQVGAADQDQAAELEKSARTWLFHSPAWLKARIEVIQSRIVRKGQKKSDDGPVCEITASDIAGSHGARPTALILNEVHAITKWEFAQNMLDNASKIPNGLVICATNAGHIGTEAWKLREIARTSPRWKFLQFDEPAPWLDAAELDEARRRNSTERYNRLFRGIWSRGLGDALDAADVEGSVDRNLLPMVGRALPSPDGRNIYPTIIAGIDLGIRHDHSAVVALAAMPATNRVRLADCRFWKPDPRTGSIDLEAVEAGILDLHARLHCAAYYFDPYQAELMAQRLSKRGLRMIPMPFVGSNLNIMATTILEAFRSHRVDLYDCPRLVSDLLRLTIVEKSYGHKLEATRDVDGHADTATAFAIALPAAIEATTRFATGQVVTSPITLSEMAGGFVGSSYRPGF